MIELHELKKFHLLFIMNFVLLIEFKYFIFYVLHGGHFAIQFIGWYGKQLIWKH